MDLDLIDLAALNPERVAAWAEVFKTSGKKLTEFLRRLTKGCGNVETAKGGSRCVKGDSTEVETVLGADFGNAGGSGGRGATGIREIVG
jgi:hypothetical protein